MLKIALLITGTTRNYKENFITWKKYLLDLFDVDIFFHTYDITGYHNDIHNNNKNTNIFNGDEIIDLLKPKKHVIDNFSNKINEFKNLIVSQCSNNASPKPEFIKAQLYSIYKTNELKKEHEMENDMEYDIVIKIRFDTIFYSNFNIEDVVKIYNFNNVILCGNQNIMTMKYKNACTKCINNFEKLNYIKCAVHDDVSDIVVISKSHIINYYADIYNKYDNYINLMLIESCRKNNNDIDKYIGVHYDNKEKIYYNVPRSQCPFPEKILALYLKDYILLNYSMSLDINRNVV